MPEERHDHEKRNGRIKSAGTWLYGRWKSRGAGSKLKTLVQALVATSVAGGLTVGAIGYSQALDAKTQLAALQNTVDAITGPVVIPTPPDLTEAVGTAQTAADGAQTSADAAATSAAGAKDQAQGALNSANAAQTSAGAAQASADQALASVPVLRAFTTLVITVPPSNSNYTIGEFDIKAGTHEFRFTNGCSPTTNIGSYQVILAEVNPDSSVTTLANLGAVGSCPQSRLAYVPISHDSRVRLYWHVVTGDAVVHTMGQQTLLTTKVNG